MKIKAIRTITDEDRKKALPACGEASGDGTDKPPC